MAIDRNLLSGGTTMLLLKLLEEKEAESRTRSYSGPAGTAITILLCVWTVFQLYYSTFGVMSAINLRAFHCIFLLAFTFLLYPTYKRERRGNITA